MALLDSLKNSSLGLKGATPKNSEGLNNNPLDTTTLKASQLDLDGKTPSQYLNNLPE